MSATLPSDQTTNHKSANHKLAKSEAANHENVKPQTINNLVAPKPAAKGQVPVYSLGLLLSLYLAQGLPVGFMTQALPAILRQYGVSLTAIGGFGLLMAPWALKFLWAPLVDRYYSEKTGQSRSWILPTQMLTVLCVASIAWFEPALLHQPVILVLFFALLLVMNFCAASQDIATDALAVRIVGSSHRHWVNTMQVLGSRLGYIFGGGVILWLLDYWHWAWVYIGLAVLVLLNTLPILRYREPVWKQEWADEWNKGSAALPSPHQDSLNVKKSWRVWRHWFANHFGYFWKTRELRLWLLVLVTYKVSDGIANGMVKPMMVDMGFKLSDIGLMASMLGAVASLAGAGLAAWWMHYLSRTTALWLFNLFQTLCALFYDYLAWQFEYYQQVVAWQVFSMNALECVAAAMALVSMLTVVMDYARPAHAGSDFTFQVSIMAVVGGLGYLVSGAMADTLGYTLHFSLSGIIGLILLFPIFMWQQSLKSKN